jgi:hypothetical protein
MKARHLILAAGLAAAALVALFGDKTPVGGVAEPVARTQPTTPRAAPGAAPAADNPAPKGGAAVFVLPLRDRSDLIGEAQLKGDKLFGSQNWAPPAPPAAKELPPPAPVAPPLPFTYLGKSLQDGRWEVYLARGSMTYIVHTQMVVDGAYRVDAITPPVLSLTYLPLNQVQQLNIGVLD